MKSKIIIGIAFFSVFGIAEELKITAKMKKILCGRMQRVIPTDTGSIYSIKNCISETFEVKENQKDRFVIEWTGSTVEDMSTICEVEWAKDEKVIRKLNKASCDLQ